MLFIQDIPGTKTQSTVLQKDTMVCIGSRELQILCVVGCDGYALKNIKICQNCMCQIKAQHLAFCESTLQSSSTRFVTLVI